MVFVDLFRKPLILLTFLDFGLVDRLWFLRVVLWSCGSLVVFGSRVAHCVSETGKATRSGINQGGMRVTCAKRTACKSARVAPTTRPKNRKRRAIVVFCRLCGFWASLWFFAVFVVFGRACGFWASLWFLGELVVGRRVPFPISHRPILQSPSHQHRRGFTRRGLFRVFAHSKVFALLLPKNAS